MLPIYETYKEIIERMPNVSFPKTSKELALQLTAIIHETTIEEVKDEIQKIADSNSSYSTKGYYNYRI